MEVKKLIEVALPLEKINAASAREKSIRHGHPSTLHLWWARRPLAAARAVIWASLVDDPSSHPEQFPTTEEQNAERKRLFHILEDLVVWENSNSEEVLNRAKAEILKSTDHNPPALLDPFAGGGAIPLEAQRLGLEAHAHDLNPVAVMINKAMIEIPPRFAGQKPVNPEAHKTLKDGWTGAGGLAEDVRYYGEWMKRKAFERIGHLYPKVKVPKEQGGGEATVIAWIWARTVKCPNPACGCQMPLASSFVLSKKKGNIAGIIPSFEDGVMAFHVTSTEEPPDGTIIKTGAKCISCGSTIPFSGIRQQVKTDGFKSDLMAIVAEGKRGRLYISPSAEHKRIADVPIPDDIPHASLPEKALGFRIQGYGLKEYSDLFTPRQLTALTTFSDLVAEAQAQAEADAVVAGLNNDHVPLSQGGRGAKAYGEAVGVYLGFLVDQIANHSSNVCGWNSVNAQMRNTFGRQAIPMVWDYAECNIFSNSSGSFNSLFDRMIKGFSVLGNNSVGYCKQEDARSDSGLRNIMVSSDPPYYDNIGYADLSDFFYIWMRRSLKSTFPNLFRIMLVPKTEELIAAPYRHDGSKDKAKQFFEDGMLATCKQIYQYAREDIPVTIYYAYKQSDTDVTEEGTASSGWETMLNSIVQAGFAITGTWPMRTEKPGRMRGNSSNALATSVVIVCRKRSANAGMATRRNFINALKRELRPALQKLQSSNIAPVDLAQSAIGPGMGVFSRYSQVLEADGSPMTVRSALKIINQELDLYFNEQDGELDSESRFCVDLYTQYAFNDMKFGDANTLATAKNTSVALMASHGTLYAQKGVVRLVERPELPGSIDGHGDNIWLLCQQLTHRMEKEGIEGVARALAALHGSAAEQAKDLAYRLYTIAERKKWQQEAYAYNSLVVAWPEIQTRAGQMKSAEIDQISMYGEEE